MEGESEDQRRSRSKLTAARAALGKTACAFAIERYVPPTAAAAPSCPRCARSFDLDALLRYNCGGCGSCVCDGCSAERVELVPGAGEARVCGGSNFTCPGIADSRRRRLAALRAVAEAERVATAEEAVRRMTRSMVSCATSGDAKELRRLLARGAPQRRPGVGAGPGEQRQYPLRSLIWSAQNGRADVAEALLPTLYDSQSLYAGAAKRL